MSKEKISLFTLLKSDFQRYKAAGGKNNFKIFFNLGFIGTSIFRINRSVYYTIRPVPIFGKIIALLSFFNLKFMQLFFGFSFPEATQIGKGIFISHLGTIILNSNVVIGENCNLGPMIVIGWGHSKGKDGCPTLGNRVWIGPGAKIFGPIKIGNDVAIGANAVVNFDVPDNSTVVGNPARIIENKGSQLYIKF